MNTLGTELKTLRGQQNLTQSEAAKRIGIEQSFLSKLESDQSWASVEVLRRICNAYGIRPAQLLSQVDAECLRGNVNYQSLLVDERRRKAMLVSIGIVSATVFFLLLWWAATERYLSIPGLVSAKPEYTKVSLQFEQIEAGVAVALIAEYGNLEIVNPELLEGKMVSVRVEELPWPDALAEVLEQVELRVEIDGNRLMLKAQ